MWEMQILQKGSTAGDATDSETGESGSSSHSVDDNRQNYNAVHSTGECSPVHTKHGNINNTNQTIINVSGTAFVGCRRACDRLFVKDDK